MGITLKKYQIRAAMKDHLIMPISIMRSRAWKGAPQYSRMVLVSFFHQIWDARPRELRPDVDRDLPSQLKVRKALANLVERGLIVKTLTKPDRYALNFPPYDK
ncbi:hypothetical protein [Pseudomonas syringae group genomosp. 3]|uniref:MarR family transcriptional regulator n=1 Tax=Pseudomonas syringae pv. tomato (strain ATCC BAA-871 / DC3000) TaxID=223283 RepID=Q88AU3_PSESM|nr:hypothetical protein [Pseudomonas syringae group genomosp. 3]AAO53838.1 protein of unknown function [Pseudomonas syringae pv. tomato str. DC3000]KPY85869.1 Uncharacterized protein ALO36_03538 [Pseudomonas syringae pv. tomato]